MNEKLKQFLDRKVEEYNRPAFIAADPVSVPHRFSGKEDIEIAGLFAALFAWGNRTTIIYKSRELMQRMDGAPYDFIRHHGEKDLRSLIGFKHRTFTDTDLLYFVQFLQQHYKRSGTLETAFSQWMQGEDKTVERALNGFYLYFFNMEDAPLRTRKHIAAPVKGSTCKRINMFLRWMVRSDNCGVDFGIWKGISPAQLVCPVDVHVARVARRFGLLQRAVTDWQAAVELTGALKRFDAADPVRYDFALFSLGITEKF